MRRKLILEDGSVFEGEGFGSLNDKILELVFNTSMVGYQEILSDPSYTYQGVVMTYPLIGNYGMCDEDYETDTPSLGGFVVREYCNDPSNFRCKETLEAIMKKYNVVGVSGVDTRKIARHIRDIGSCKAYVVSADRNTEEALAELRASGIPNDAVGTVSTKEIYEFDPCKNNVVKSLGLEKRYKVVAIDCGMKKNILRELYKKGCDVTVVPWNTPAKDIMAMKPDGVFISNGPGDPTDVPPTIETIKELIGQVPIFGICLGHQIISLAYGAKTYKLKFGHRGGNHPVKDTASGKIEITSQNHSYAVDVETLKNTKLKVSKINLLDETVEGVKCEEDKVFSIQYHPESAPGPQDSTKLFDDFIELMKEGE